MIDQSWFWFQTFLYLVRYEPTLSKFTSVCLVLQRREDFPASNFSVATYLKWNRKFFNTNKKVLQLFVLVTRADVEPAPRQGNKLSSQQKALTKDLAWWKDIGCIWNSKWRKNELLLQLSNVTLITNVNNFNTFLSENYLRELMPSTAEKVSTVKLKTEISRNNLYFRNLLINYLSKSIFFKFVCIFNFVSVTRRQNIFHLTYR